jgi:hypothetical protein
MVGSCEHGNELLGSVRGQEFDYLSVLLASQEGLCSMVLLVSVLILWPLIYMLIASIIAPNDGEYAPLRHQSVSTTLHGATSQ